MTPFQALPLGAVRPRGWLLAQLRRDLEHGFAGRLDGLTPHAARDLFRERMGSSDDFTAWWDAETRGNWLWGYVMMASLAGVPEHEERAAGLMRGLLATRDPDAYIGIYAPDGRYRHAAGENGELWGQSRALLSLIAFHEGTGDEQALAAIQEAVDLTLRQYPEGRPYFQRGERLGRDLITGLTHGLCYLDVLEWLHERTGDVAYARAGVRFYREFSGMPLPFPNDDLALPNLADPRHTFGGHAVHTAEHLRALLWASSIAPDEVPPELVRVALQRVRRHRVASGALIGDENVHGLPLPESPYEFCTSTELGFSLSSAIQKLGDAALADWLETLAFNAVQGARLPDGSAIAYLSADTRLYATADRPDSHGPPGRRFKYSPTHDDVACCCNPNAVRFLPQYVSRMWLRLSDEPGFAAVAYGPCELHARVGDVDVTIVEKTDYPFSDRIDFEVRPERPVEFTLLLRLPDRASIGGTYSGRGDESEATGDPDGTGAEPAGPQGWYRIRREWRAGDTASLRLLWGIEPVVYPNGEVGVFRGPVQYVLPVRHRLTAIRDYAGQDLHDYDIAPQDIAQGYRIPVLADHASGLGLSHSDRVGDPDRPWDAPLSLLRIGDTTLVPMGCTVLRRASFPLRSRRSPFINWLSDRDDVPAATISQQEQKHA